MNCLKINVGGLTGKVTSFTAYLRMFNSWPTRQFTQNTENADPSAAPSMEMWIHKGPKFIGSVHY